MAGKKLKEEWAIDLSRALSGPLRNRVGHIGIELEGVWPKDPAPYTIIRDGSVKDFAAKYQHYRIGELPSPRLCVLKGFDKEAEPFMRKYYPEAVNASCGMHVHMSFVTLLNYQRTLRSEFPMTVIAEVRRWAEEQKIPKTHHIWNRLAGGSEYCQFVYSGPEQLLNRQRDYDKQRVGNRYSVINYNYGRTGTVECRLLPMFDDIDQSISAIKRILDVTNAFLVVTAKREKSFQATVTDDTKNREVRELYV